MRSDASTDTPQEERAMTQAADHECDGKPVYFRIVYVVRGEMVTSEADYCCQARVPDAEAWPAEAEPVQITVCCEGIETTVTGGTVQITTSLETYVSLP
jgi:hypothetical protein